MPEPKHLLIEYAGILRDWVLPAFRKISFRGAAERVRTEETLLERNYATALVAEVFWWLQLGLDRGFFPVDATRSLQRRVIPALQRNLPLLGSRTPIPLSSPASPVTVLQFQIDDPYFQWSQRRFNTRGEWPDFRTELLLARAFARGSSIQMFLSMLQFSTLSWNDVLKACNSYDVLAAAVAETDRTPMGEFNAPLFINGFLSTIDYMASTQNSRRQADGTVPSFTDRDIAFIRRCRLDLSDDNKRGRFLAVADVVDRLLNSHESQVPPSEAVSTPSTTIDFSTRVRQLVDGWRMHTYDPLMVPFGSVLGRL